MIHNHPKEIMRSELNKYAILRNIYLSDYRETFGDDVKLKLEAQEDKLLCMMGLTQVIANNILPQGVTLSMEA